MLLVTVDNDNIPEELPVEFMSVDAAKESGMYTCNDTSVPLSPMYVLTTDNFVNEVSFLIINKININMYKNVTI